MADQKQRVEGYDADQDEAEKPREGADSWVNGVRNKNRKDMIDRIVSSRIKDGGLNGGPRRGGRKAKVARFCESVAVGVTVMVIGGLILKAVGGGPR